MRVWGLWPDARGTQGPPSRPLGSTGFWLCFEGEPFKQTLPSLRATSLGGEPGATQLLGELHLPTQDVVLQEVEELRAMWVEPGSEASPPGLRRPPRTWSASPLVVRGEAAACPGRGRCCSAGFAASRVTLHPWLLLSPLAHTPQSTLAPGSRSPEVGVGGHRCRVTGRLTRPPPGQMIVRNLGARGCWAVRS